MRAGHLFVVHGRLERTPRDAEVLPTDAAFEVSDFWRPVLQERPERLRPADWGRSPGDRRWGRSRDGRPLWFLDVDVPDEAGGRPVEWLMSGLTEVLEDVATARLSPSAGRSLPLVAMPVLGVEGGGYDAVRGDVVASLLSTCRSVAEERGLDVVLVCREAADYAAVQEARRGDPGSWSSLDEETLDLARDLGGRARRGELALFLGAGVSMPAGVPGWSELLDDLRGECGADVDAEGFARLSLLDRAELLRRQVGGRDELRALVAKRSTAALPALSHTLLASLQCREVVTTNYDTLYEQAVAALTGEPPSVLPWDTVVPGRPWLLKMHGDVDHLDAMVLTRQDFVRYDALLRPVGSVVQTLLLSRHLLVVGASMTDDNVLRLAHEVIELLERGAHRRALGTVVTLTPDPAKRQLWEGLLDHRSASAPGTDPAEAAGRLEVLLDAVAAYGGEDGSYLLDERYAGLLGEQEQQVAATLREAMSALARLPEGSVAAWSRLQRDLRRYGAAVPDR